MLEILGTNLTYLIKWRQMGLGEANFGHNSTSHSNKK